MPQTLNLSTDGDSPDSDRQVLARDEAAQRDAAQADEANMRRALGMLGGPAGQSQSRQTHPRQPQTAQARRTATPISTAPRRHRFVQDGDVPVTVMRTRPEGADLAAAVNGSPVNRLDAVQASLVAERAARERAERALEEAQTVIRDLRTKLAHMELAREESLKPREPEPQVPEAASPEPAEPAIRAVRVPKKLAVPRPPRAQKEPQPVKWWVKPRAKKADAKP